MSYGIRVATQWAFGVSGDALSLFVCHMVSESKLFVPKYPRTCLQGVFPFRERDVGAAEEGIASFREGVGLKVSPGFDIPRIIGVPCLTQWRDCLFNVIIEIAHMSPDFRAVTCGW